MIEPNSIHNLDCLTLCSQMEPESVDLILCDLPYGTTDLEWDQVIPLDKMWSSFKRIVKPSAVMIFTCIQPLTSQLLMSNPKQFNCELIWDKGRPANTMHAKSRPVRFHENILVFVSGGGYTYNAQKQYDPRFKRIERAVTKAPVYHGGGTVSRWENDGGMHPRSILDFTISNHERGIHPTQKPITLFEWLIRSYSNEGDLVFDPTAGSGTTAVAAKNTGRLYIVGDTDPYYCQVMKDRLRDTPPPKADKSGKFIQGSLFGD